MHFNFATEFLYFYNGNCIENKGALEPNSVSPWLTEIVITLRSSK